MNRCEWATTELSIAYHDEEWGVPVQNDRTLLEFLILEGARAGLSRETILKKRDSYRLAFDGFDAVRIAGYDEAKVRQLLADPGIVRNKLKIRAAIDEQRSEAAWFPPRRPHDLLRVHAGGGDGERPRGRMLPLRRSRLTGSCVGTRNRGSPPQVTARAAHSLETTSGRRYPRAAMCDGLTLGQSPQRVPPRIGLLAGALAGFLAEAGSTGRAHTPTVRPAYRVLRQGEQQLFA